MPAHVRVRRGAVALVAAFLGLFLTAGPAAAATPWPTTTSGDGSTVVVGISNGGAGPLLVKVSQSVSEFNVNLTSGCGTAPPQGVTFAVCLPAEAYMAFSAFLASPAAD
jgi:hypothetical protein